MTSERDLKDCPMCGCAATFVKHSAGMPGTQGYDKWDAVACKHCRTTVGACDRRFRSKDDAATAWNRRAQHSTAEPFGYFRADSFGWTDCAATDDGAVALYEAAPQQAPLTDEQIDRIWSNSTPSNFEARSFARAIERALGISAAKEAT